MAKRWLTSKTFKMKKYREKSRRGALKMYSAAKISTGSSPNKEVMQMYRNSAKWLGVSMEELYRYNREPVSVERQAARDLRNNIKNACPEFMYFRLVDDSWLRARMYFHFNPEMYYIVEFNPRTKGRRRSIQYKNRDVAYTRWSESTIDWVPSAKFYHPSIPETYPPSD